MASGNLLSERRPINEPESVLYFDMEKSDDKGEPVICAVFNTFGRIEDSTNNLSVTFDVITVDGRNETHTFDITALFHTEECRKYHWLLLEERITVGKPEGGRRFCALHDFKLIEIPYTEENLINYDYLMAKAGY